MNPNPNPNPSPSPDQAQQYYARSMPGLGFFVLMTFTWPLLGAHLVQVLSGAAKAAGFARRIYSAFLLSGGVGVAFIAQDPKPTPRTLTREP